MYSPRTWLRMGVLAGLMAAGAAGQAPVRVIFLEPVSAVDTKGAEISTENLLYRLAANPERYTPWLNNESAARAFRLYRDACEIAHPGGGVPDYYVALVKGGNHAATGFRLESGGKVEEHPRQPYILLDAEDWRFETTLLHETGHMAISMLAGGRGLAAKEIASIPHSTAALTGSRKMTRTGACPAAEAAIKPASTPSRKQVISQTPFDTDVPPPESAPIGAVKEQ